MDAILAIAVILLAAALVWLLAQRILTALNIHPADPDDRASGFQDVLDRIHSWAEQRRDRE